MIIYAEYTFADELENFQEVKRILNGVKLTDNISPIPGRLQLVDGVEGVAILRTD